MNILQNKPSCSDAGRGAPCFDIDLYSDAVLRAPYDIYAEMRADGPVVYLSRHDTWALPRQAEVKAALEDHETFISGKGVGLSEFGNKTRLGTPIASDPPLHTLVRGIVADRLSLRAIRETTPEIQRQADVLVAEVLERGSFDGVHDFARRFPLLVMADLIGLPEDGREHLLEWADAGFNLSGQTMHASSNRCPNSRRFAYVRSLEQPGRLCPGSM